MYFCCLSAIITSVAMFDIEVGFAPPTPWCRVPIYLTLGAIKKAPAVDEQDRVIVRRQMKVTGLCEK